MDAMVWMTGYVGGEVEYRTVKEELTFASFRLACTPRMWRGGEWVDGETTWIVVSCSRGLADNVRSSVGKGDPVVVAGKLRTDRWTDAQGGSHERMVIEAVSVGHDLSRGTSVFRRTSRGAQPVAEVTEISESAA